MSAEPLIDVAPVLHVPSRAPQVRSARESMFTWPSTFMAPRVMSEAGGGARLKRNWWTVAWIFWRAVELPVVEGAQPTATTLRSLALVPLGMVTAHQRA